MNRKIGVYICHCGGNISDYVDVEKIRAAVGNEKGVVLVKTTLFACADANQKEMENDIRKHELNGVIVASCSPKLHLNTFRAVVERAGLNKYNYIHANIREQVSWAHSDDRAGATENAIHLVKAAIARIQHAESFEPIRIDSKKAVAVIGGGIAGLKAAIGLAKMNCPVYLIEQNHFVGGRTAQWEELFTSQETGYAIVKRLYNEFINYENATLFTGAQVIENTGNIGNFELKVRLNPSFVVSSINQKEIQQAIDVCPVSVNDPFNFGLTQRKAIFRNSPGEFPEKTVIDMNVCNRCGKCKKVCKSIDLTQKEQNITLDIGSVVFATGFDPYMPKENEFGYGTLDNVITLPQFKRLVALSDKKLMYHGKEIRNIAYIYCVGSREPEGDNKYCSRYCCTATIHTAIGVKKKFSRIQNYHFTRGVRTYGKQEAYYSDALKMGDVFLQSADNELPVVFKKENKTFVKLNDILTEQRKLELEADLVILVTSMVPREDHSTSDLFKLPKGRDKFLKEIHLKLRPVETVIDGITIAGTCQGPMNITESINSSLSAATKSFSYVSQGELELEPIVAKVDGEKCTWCNACIVACPFNAIKKVDTGTKSIAVVNISTCKGCGMCLPVCPTDAIELSTFSNPEVEEMIDMLALDL
jgi:heterodisulfide reductase subunit A